ncbi:hypothetical protein MMC28_005099 [Mycoblastus sanguinarius]|nr:hypothetical protein [Mycoblastus sanguinarius]
MTIPTTNPNTNLPPTLTATQSRALLHALLSTNANGQPRTNSTVPRSVSTKSTHHPHSQRTITIDTSTRIIGHCNNVHFSSISPMEQAVRIEEIVRGALNTQGAGEEKSKGKVNVNVTVQAGISIMGSKNVVVINQGREIAKGMEKWKAEESKEKVGMPLAGRKRRAESEPADVLESIEKKVKVDGDGLEKGV